MTTSLRWGILGTGFIAGIFARSFASCRLGTLQAVASRDGARAAAFAQAHGIPRSHGSYQALWRDAQVDAVYIATPHPNHHREAIDALLAGKHVLVEKPIAVSVREVEEMMEAAGRAQRVLLEAFMYRVHPQTARLQQVLARGEIGALRVVRSCFSFNLGGGQNVRYDRRLHGGALWDVGCYCINASRMIAGEEPVGISAQSWVDREHAVDCHTVGALRFPSGLVAHFDVGIRSAFSASLEILGEGGRIHMPNPWKPAADRASFTVESSRGLREEVIEGGGDIYALEADHLAEVVAGRIAASPISAAEGLANTRVLEALHRSIYG